MVEQSDGISTWADRFFADRFPAESVRDAERAGSWGQAWADVDAIGLLQVGIPESRGGGGGSFADAAAVLASAGRHCVPLPVVDAWLGNWLAAEAGLEVTERYAAGLVSAPPASAALGGDDCWSGELGPVAWGRAAAFVVAPRCDRADGNADVIRIEVATAEHRPGTDLAGMPSDVIVGESATLESGRTPVKCARVEAVAQWAIASVIAGAIEAASALSLQYAQQREQFGRAIGSYQAVQQHLVVLEQAATLATSASSRAAMALDEGGGGIESLAAHVVASQAAGTAVRAAHQVHGAIGMTKEYPLQLITRRLMGWQQELIGEREASRRLGATVGTKDGLMELVTTRRGVENDV